MAAPADPNRGISRARGSESGGPATTFHDDPTTTDVSIIKINEKFDPMQLALHYLSHKYITITVVQLYEEQRAGILNKA